MSKNFIIYYDGEHQDGEHHTCEQPYYDPYINFQENNWYSYEDTDTDTDEEAETAALFHWPPSEEDIPLRLQHFMKHPSEDVTREDFDNMSQYVTEPSSMAMLKAIQEQHFNSFGKKPRKKAPRKKAPRKKAPRRKTTKKKN